ncbi:hypothetical protein [Sediminispirochaeta bajacaliforniensis]|uniref:hypothetical protein n=1 Tax=Sediminispirochaeta bajacaliforniensis TaxID=148 RepID=UPI000370CA5B|nr:hypothetical protein [Sediminispirochaeta bajacaliforniensis]
MEPTNEELRNYLNDLKEMKGLATRHEEKPLVEYWDFLSWGVLIVLGTLLHVHFFPASLDRALLVIWLPIVIIGGFVETFAWLNLIKRLDTPISLRQNQRFYLSLLVIFIATMFILFYLIHLEGPVLGMILLIIAILFASVAQITYLALFAETIITLTLGIIFTVLDVQGQTAAVTTGLFAGLAFFVMGIHTRILEKRNG